MKSIKFSESELEFLQNHYELELLDAENYVGEIKNILKKLGAIEPDDAKAKPAKNIGKKRGRPKKEQKIEAEVIAAANLKPEKTGKSAKKTTPVKKTKTKVDKVATEKVSDNKSAL